MARHDDSYHDTDYIFGRYLEAEHERNTATNHFHKKKISMRDRQENQLNFDGQSYLDYDN